MLYLSGTEDTFAGLVLPCRTSWCNRERDTAVTAAFRCHARSEHKVEATELQVTSTSRGQVRRNHSWQWWMEGKYELWIKTTRTGNHEQTVWLEYKMRQSSNSKWRWMGKAAAKPPSFMYHADDQVRVLERSVCSVVRDGRRDFGQRVKKCWVRAEVGRTERKKWGLKLLGDISFVPVIGGSFWHLVPKGQQC